jgi:CopG family nickel-responsive transcriptional regulator
MAKIISVSLDEKLLAELSQVEKTMGFSGRSDAIRSGMKLLIDDVNEKDKLKGHAECVLVFMHGKDSETAFVKTKHKYEEIITTQVHSNFCNDKCLEVCVLHGPAERITSFFSEIRRNRKADYAKLVVP